MDRPQLGHEGALGGVVDLGPDDVAGQQVRRALDPAEVRADGLGHGLRGGGLRQPGTLSSRMWPPVMSPTSRDSRSLAWPTTLASKLREMAARVCCARASSAGSIRAAAIV